MDKHSKRVLLGAATVAAMLGAQKAHAAVTANVNIDAVIVSAIAVTAVANLKFGTASEAGAGGTLQIQADGTRNDGVGITSIGATTAQAGEFQVKMTGGVAYTVNTTVTSVNLTGPGAAMPVNTFVWAPAATPTAGAAFPFTAIGAGTTATTDVYKLGGTLTIGAAQAAGAYSGTIGITVSYQ